MNSKEKNKMFSNSGQVKDPPPTKKTSKLPSSHVEFNQLAKLVKTARNRRYFVRRAFYKDRTIYKLTGRDVPVSLYFREEIIY